MKKILLFVSSISFGQVATSLNQQIEIGLLRGIKPGNDTTNQSLRIQNNYLNRIYSQDSLIQIEASITSTNAATAYTVGRVVGGSSGSNFSTTIPNGVYKINSAIYGWQNTALAPCAEFLLLMFDSTITNSTDNAICAVTASQLIRNFQSFISFSSPFIISLGTPLKVGTVGAISPTASSVKNETFFRVKNGYILFNIIVSAACTPASGSGYRFKITLQKVSN